MSSTVDDAARSPRDAVPEFRERRALVLERDGYECQHCRRTGGERGGTDLQVHRLGGDAGTAPETLVTLCRYCHYRAHSGSAGCIDRHLR